MVLSPTLYGDNPQQPSIAAEVYVPDQLIAGTLHLVTQQVTVTTGNGVLPRGQCLGLNTSTHKWAIATQAGSNGLNVVSGILVDQTDTTSADATNSDVYVMGEFNSAALTYDNSFTVLQLQQQAAAGLIIKITSAGLTQVPEA